MSVRNFTTLLVVTLLAIVVLPQAKAENCCDLLGWGIGAGTSQVCASSRVVNGQCSGLRTYREAEAICAALGNGARLCTYAEVNIGEAQFTGCNYDTEVIWTSTECIGGWATTLGQGGASSGCGNTIDTAYVRCCADTSCDVVTTPPPTTTTRVTTTTAATTTTTRATTTTTPATTTVATTTTTRAPTTTTNSGCNNKCAQLGWEVAGGSDAVCGSSGSCSGGVSYSRAVEFCAAEGGRLCTVEELLNDEAALTGCNYDVQRVWSSSACSGGHRAAMGATHAGVYDECIPDSEILVARCCADVCDGATTTTAATTTTRATTTTTRATTTTTRATTTTTRATTTTTRATTTTTAATTTTTAATTTTRGSCVDTCANLGWEVAGGTRSVCGASRDSNGDCSGQLSYDEAVNFCSTEGGRLCTSEELIAGEAALTGCGYDTEQVWSSDSCSTGHKVAYGSPEFGDSAICYENAARFAVRCCADTCSTGVTTTTARTTTTTTTARTTTTTTTRTTPTTGRTTTTQTTVVTSTPIVTTTVPPTTTGFTTDRDGVLGPAVTQCKKFYKVPENKRFSRVVDRCRNIDASATLAIIKNEQEHYAVTELLDKLSAYAWVGARVENGDIHWLDGHVYSGAFKATENGCLVISNDGEYIVTPCSATVQYVCQIEEPNCVQTTTETTTSTSSTTTEVETTPEVIVDNRDYAGVWRGVCRDFYLVHANKRYNRADNICRSVLGDGAVLASVHSAEDVSILHKILDFNGGDAWIGGRVNADLSVDWNDGSSDTYDYLTNGAQSFFSSSRPYIFREGECLSLTQSVGCAGTLPAVCVLPSTSFECGGTTTSTEVPTTTSTSSQTTSFTTTTTTFSTSSTTTSTTEQTTTSSSTSSSTTITTTTSTSEYTTTETTTSTSTTTTTTTYSTTTTSTSTSTELYTTTSTSSTSTSTSFTTSTSTSTSTTEFETQEPITLRRDGVYGPSISGCKQFFLVPLNKRFSRIDNLCQNMFGIDATPAVVDGKKDRRAISLLLSGPAWIGGQYDGFMTSWHNGLSMYQFGDITGRENGCVTLNELNEPVTYGCNSNLPFVCSVPVLSRKCINDFPSTTSYQSSSTSTTTTTTTEATTQRTTTKRSVPSSTSTTSSSEISTTTEHPDVLQRVNVGCSSFALISRNKRWNVAERVCKEDFGSQLASIHSRSERNAVYDMVRSNGIDSAWIGGKQVSDREMAWSDASSVDYSISVASDYNENRPCIAAIDSDTDRFDAYSCGNTKYFVCRKLIC